MAGPAADRRTRLTVLVALAAKTVGKLASGSPALLSEAAHSVADSLNEVFLLAALRRSRRPADARHRGGQHGGPRRIGLVPGIDSERVEEVSMRIRQAMADRWPQADQVFLDITNAPPRAGL